jgi:hypothetical protein
MQAVEGIQTQTGLMCKEACGIFRMAAHSVSRTVLAEGLSAGVLSAIDARTASISVIVVCTQRRHQMSDRLEEIKLTRNLWSPCANCHMSNLKGL